MADWDGKWVMMEVWLANIKGVWSGISNYSIPPKIITYKVLIELFDHKWYFENYKTVCSYRMTLDVQNHTLCGDMY